MTDGYGADLSGMAPTPGSLYIVELQKELIEKQPPSCSSESQYTHDHEHVHDHGHDHSNHHQGIEPSASATSLLLLLLSFSYRCSPKLFPLPASNVPGSSAD